MNYRNETERSPVLTKNRERLNLFSLIILIYFTGCTGALGYSCSASVFLLSPGDIFQRNRLLMNRRLDLRNAKLASNP